MTANLPNKMLNFLWIEFDFVTSRETLHVKTVLVSDSKPEAVRQHRYNKHDKSESLKVQRLAALRFLFDSTDFQQH